MMREVKISLIGAGSLTFSPALLKAICESNLVKECKVTLDLFDIDSKILERFYNLSNKIIEYYKKLRGNINLSVKKAINRKELFENADFVILTIGVGGIEATLIDGNTPLEYGIPQFIADTVGPGGFMRGIRHIPVVVNIANELHDISPNAIIINYSNPMTPLVRAIRRETKIEAYGLCTGIFGCINFLSNFLGVDKHKLNIFEAGINHFTWITKFSIDGNDGYELLEKRLNEEGIPTGYRSIITIELYKLFNLFPVAGDRHVAEFFPKIFMNKKIIEKYQIPLFPYETVYLPEKRKILEDILIKVIKGKLNIEEFLQQEFLEKEGVEAISLIEGFILNKKTLFPGINVPNNGCLNLVPSEAIVEIPAYVDSCGVHPISVGALPKGITGIINKRYFFYEIEIDAALSGDRDQAIQALILDGYIDSIDLAREFLNKMIEKEKKWLPEYWFK